MLTIETGGLLKTYGINCHNYFNTVTHQTSDTFLQYEYSRPTVGVSRIYGPRTVNMHGPVKCPAISQV